MGATGDVLTLGLNGQQAAASWNSEIGVDAWSERAKTNLVNTELSSTYQKHEVARIYDKAVKVVFKKTGTETEVAFTRTEIKRMNNGTLTHNHTDVGCFSPEDIDMLRQGNLQEIRVATKDGVYRLQQPKEWTSEIDSFNKIEDRYYEIDRIVSKPIFDRARMGEITYKNADRLAQEATVKSFCEEHGIPFKYHSWTSLGKEL